MTRDGTRPIALVTLSAFLAMACYTTESLKPPFDAQDLDRLEEGGQVRIVRTDGQTLSVGSGGSWILQGDSILGYRKEAEEDLPADVTVQVSEIDRVEIKTGKMSTAEVLILVGMGVGVAFVLALGANLPDT